MFQYVPRSEARRGHTKRPQSVPVENGPCPSTGSATPSVDPAALMGHSLKLQQWLNDRQVKSLQVGV